MAMVIGIALLLEINTKDLAFDNQKRSEAKDNRNITLIEKQIASLSDDPQRQPDMPVYRKYGEHVGKKEQIEDLGRELETTRKRLALSQESPLQQLTTTEDKILDLATQKSAGWFVYYLLFSAVVLFSINFWRWQKEAEINKDLALRLTEQAEANKNLALKQTEKVELEIKKLKQPSFHIRK